MLFMSDARETTIALNRIKGEHSHHRRPDVPCSQQIADKKSVSGEIITELTHSLKDRQRAMIGQAVPSSQRIDQFPLPHPQKWISLQFLGNGRRARRPISPPKVGYRLQPLTNGAIVRLQLLRKTQIDHRILMTEIETGTISAGNDFCQGVGHLSGRTLEQPATAGTEQGIADKKVLSESIHDTGCRMSRRLHDAALLPADSELVTIVKQFIKQRDALPVRFKPDDAKIGKLIEQFIDSTDMILMMVGA
jgi:hypothetical protein